MYNLIALNQDYTAFIVWETIIQSLLPTASSKVIKVAITKGQPTIRNNIITRRLRKLKKLEQFLYLRLNEQENENVRWPQSRNPMPTWCYFFLPAYKFCISKHSFPVLTSNTFYHNYNGIIFKSQTIICKTQ